MKELALPFVVLLYNNIYATCCLDGTLRHWKISTIWVIFLKSALTSAQNRRLERCLPANVDACHSNATSPLFRDCLGKPLERKNENVEGSNTKVVVGNRVMASLSLITM